MPAAVMKREPRRVRSARRRAAHYAHRARVAVTAEDRYAVAGDALMSAAKHSRPSVAEQVAADVTGQARHVMTLAALGGPRLALYEHKLTVQRPRLHRLGVALMCLRGAIKLLGPEQRDRLFEHYAAELQREATSLTAVVEKGA